MPCYAPLKGYQGKDNKLVFRRQESLAGNKRTVACGQCLGCRVDRSRMWAARIVHESESWTDNAFVTLTYENEPHPPSLIKHHHQDFMKRLRRKFHDRKIRYFHCGEYGDKSARPHYHTILFNLDFDDKEFFTEREGIPTYTSPTLEERWGHGFCTIGEVNWQTAAYVARYCLKKVTGPAAYDHYLWADDDGVAYDLEPEYITMSKGIGADWYEKFKSDVFPSDQMPVPGKGVLPKVARYYEKLLDKTDPECLEDIKTRRKNFFLDNKDEYTPERLYAKYKVKQAQINQLKRTL